MFRFISVRGWFRLLNRLIKVKGFRLDVYFISLNNPTALSNPQAYTYIKSRSYLSFPELLPVFWFKGSSSIPLFLSNPADFLTVSKINSLTAYIRRQGARFRILDEAFLPDGKKTLSIRRIRINDVYLSAHYLGLDLPVVEGDYAFVRNFLVWYMLIPSALRATCWGFLVGPFGTWTDKHTFRKRAKTWSDYFKSLDSIPYWMRFFIELPSMLGYQISTLNFDAKASLMPFIQPDPDRKGLSSRVDWAAWMTRLASEQLMTIKDEGRWNISFLDFIKFGDWETAGASESLRFMVDWNGEKYKVRGRRTHQKEFEDWSSICKSILYDKESVMTVIEKNEPGKVRHAFKTSDPQFFTMCYILQFANRSVASWPGYAYDDTPAKQYSEAYYDCFSGKFHHNGDFEGFDRQMSVSLQVVIVLVIRNVAMANIRLRLDGNERFAALALVKFFSYKFIFLLQNTFLKYDGVASYRRIDPHTVSKSTIKIHSRVLHCLLSGLRTTAHSGGGANFLWRAGVDELLASLMITPPTVVSRFKGDDLRERCDTYAECVARSLTLTALGLVLSPVKTTIKLNGGEFLRKECKGGFLLGYPCRTIASFNEAKPWGSGTSSIAEEIAATMASALTLHFRGCNPLTLWTIASVVAINQLLYYDLDPRLLNVPISENGMGILPWDGKGCFPKPRPTKVRPVDLSEKSGYTREYLIDVVTSRGITVSTYDTAVKRFLGRKISPRDIRPHGKVSKLDWVYSKKALEFVSFSIPIRIRPSLWRSVTSSIKQLSVIPRNGAWYKKALYFFRDRLKFFGTFKLDIRDEHILDLFLEDEILSSPDTRYGKQLSYLSRTLSKSTSIRFLEGQVRQLPLMHSDLKQICAGVIAMALELEFTRMSFISEKEISLLSLMVHGEMWTYFGNSRIFDLYRF